MRSAVHVEGEKARGGGEDGSGKVSIRLRDASQGQVCDVHLARKNAALCLDAVGDKIFGGAGCRRRGMLAVEES